MATRQQSEESRQHVLDRTKGHCAYCGIILRMNGDWVIDHIWPSAQYGANNDTNFFPACQECNRTKGNRTPAQMKDAIIHGIERHLREVYDLLSFGLCLPVAFRNTIDSLIYQVRELTVEFAFEHYSQEGTPTADEEIARLRQVFAEEDEIPRIVAAQASETSVVEVML